MPAARGARALLGQHAIPQHYPPRRGGREERQLPTVSMGLGPIMAIYQAHF